VSDAVIYLHTDVGGRSTLKLLLVTDYLNLICIFIAVEA